MANTTEKLPGEPIVIRTLDPNIQSVEEMKAGFLSTLKLLDEQKEPLIFIMDLSKSNLPDSLDNLSEATNIVARQLKVFTHPMVRQIICVTTSRFVELAARGLDSKVFGNVKVPVVHSVEEGLALARSEIKATAKV